MLTRILAIALIVAAALTLDAAFLYGVVAAPLSSALRDLHGPAPVPRLEERIPVVSERPEASLAEGPRAGRRRAGASGR